MPRIKPFGRARLAVSLLCGAVAFAATVCGVWNEWPGDEPRLIQEVSAVVVRFGQNYQQDAQQQVNAFADLIPPTWEDVKAAADRLNHSNQRIARAKALIALESHPEPYSDYEWRQRFRDAAKRYDECTTSKRARLSL